MICELIRVAELSNLTGCESTRQRAIHWFLDLDQEGSLVGFSPTTVTFATTRGQTRERRGKSFTVPANYHMQWKNEKVQSVCTNDSNWLPDFLSGPANEIFPAGVTGDQIFKARDVRRAIRQHGKRHPDRQRLYKCRLWRKLVSKAKAELPANKTLRAIAHYICNLDTLRFSELPLPQMSAEERQRLLKSFDEDKETIAFRVNGRLALSDCELKRWWEGRVGKQREEVVAHLERGADAYEPGEGPITGHFPVVFAKIPFASFNAAPFISYGLGSQTATLRLETAEKIAAGLNWLLDDDATHLKLGDETAVFWAVDLANREVQAPSFVQLLEQADPLAVRDYFRGIWGVRLPQLDTTQFHAATLLPSEGRFSVRSWHTDTLANADKNVRTYFKAISLGDEDDETPSLSGLAWATISRGKRQKAKPAPSTYTGLFQAALFGTPLPYKMLASAISRQKAELAGTEHTTRQFRERLVARTALIKLHFAVNRKEGGERMDENHPAYLCGRLLAILDEIHNEAHDHKSASSPASRMYGAASTTPALAFPQLCKLVRHHLNKLSSYDQRRFEFGVPAGRRADEVGEDFEGLAAVAARLKQAAGGNFPRTLSLEDQGRFAIGFYYERQRCKEWPHFKKSEADQT